MKRLKLSLLVLVLILLFAATIYGASITFLKLNVAIDDDSPTTEDELICSWTPSGDTTDQNASWYLNGTFYSQNLTPDNNQIALPAFTAKKGDNWTCSVNLTNGTATVRSNISFIIQNADPTPPNATDATIYEDVTYDPMLVSADVDNDVLIYFQVIGPSFCSITSGGSVSCLVDHDDLTPNPQVNYNLTYVVLDEDFGSNAKNVTYTAYEVNDPPIMTLTNQTATEGSLYNYTITVTDEENDVPITFTLTTNSTSLQLQTADNLSTNLIFNRPDNEPILADKGTWWVSINATDNGSLTDTPYDNPTTIRNITLTVDTINHLPNITTNLSNPLVAETQGNLLTKYVYANDTDPVDTLTFSMNSNCSITPNPWSIATLNNSPTNGTGLINLTLTNDHVVCRWVTVTVSDGDGDSSQTAFFNLTNVNDAPFINRYSYAAGNIGTDMDNLTLVKGVTFVYTVNATDNDSLTYEGEILNFTDNSTLFDINATTGKLSFLANSTHVGNHTLLINVSDDDGNWSNRTLSIFVNNNTVPTLNLIANVTCQENDACGAYLIANDPDPGEDLVFTTNDTIHFPIFDYNATTWRFNITNITDSLIGVYTVLVTVSDQYGFSDNQTVTLNYSNVNDAPFFDGDQNGVRDTFNIKDTVIGQQRQLYINVTDEDLIHGTETISFNFTFIAPDPGNLEAEFSLTKQGLYQALASFTPLVGQNGSHQVNITVYDLLGIIDWHVANISVYIPPTDPVVQQIKPYYNSAVNDSVDDSFALATLYSLNITSVNFTENTIVTFDALITNDTNFNHSGDNNLDYAWYVDGSLEDTNIDVNVGHDSNASIAFDFFSEGTHNVTLIATDEGFSTASWEWEVNISNVNRPPVLLNELPNITVNSSTTLNDYFAYHTDGPTWMQHFYDPDDDPDSNFRRAGITGEATNLTYALINASSCSIAEITSSGGDDINIDPLTVGTCLLIFNATDPDGESVNSGIVWLTIDEVFVQEVQVPISSTSTSTTRPRPVPIPIEEPIEIPHPLLLITPEKVITYANETFDVPITISNTWSEAIMDVRLTANNSNESLNLTYKFTQNYFPFLEADENTSVTLTVGNYRAEGPTSITITATVDDPEYSDTANVLISSLEKKDSGESVENKITFARDLLNDNPECQELNELLGRADDETKRKNYEMAVKLINTAVNGCKYLINERKEPITEQPKSFFTYTRLPAEYLPAVLMGAVILGILIVFGVVMVITGRRHKNLKGI